MERGILLILAKSIESQRDFSSSVTPSLRSRGHSGKGRDGSAQGAGRSRPCRGIPRPGGRPRARGGFLRTFGRLPPNFGGLLQNFWVFFSASPALWRLLSHPGGFPLLPGGASSEFWGLPQHPGDLSWGCFAGKTPKFRDEDEPGSLFPPKLLQELGIPGWESSLRCTKDPQTPSGHPRFLDSFSGRSSGGAGSDFWIFGPRVGPSVEF